MKDLLTFVTSGLAGTDDFTIEEETNEGGINYIIQIPKDYVGLIIGKGGQTIKAIRNIAKVKATLDKTLINVSVQEK